MNKRRDYNSRCSIQVDGGGDCWNEPHPASRHGLCMPHWREAVEDWVEDAPVLVRQCPQCFIENRFDPIYWAAARCGRCGADMSDPEVVLNPDRSLPRPRVESPPLPRGVVYYIQFGSLIKIGFSTNLRRRMKVIPHDAILAIEPGDLRRERERHGQFADHRVFGQREWYHPAPALLTHIEAVRVEHGRPKQFALKA